MSHLTRCNLFVSFHLIDDDDAYSSVLNSLRRHADKKS